jgi:hypothetical protein
MNCKYYKELIMKHVDKKDNDIDKIKLFQHFKVCSGCNMEFNQMKQISKMLEEDEFDDGIIPPDFEQKVLFAVKEEKVRGSKTGILNKLNFNAVVAISALSTLIVSFLLILTNWHQEFRSFFELLFRGLKIVINLSALISKVIFDISMSIIDVYYYVFILLISLLVAGNYILKNLIADDGGSIR